MFIETSAKAGYNVKQVGTVLMYFKDICVLLTTGSAKRFKKFFEHVLLAISTYCWSFTWNRA